VPEDVVFKTKPQIALDQIKAARAEGVPEGVVLADAGYGIHTAFRTALTRMGLTYVVGIQSSARFWPPGAGPLPPKAWTGQGRPPTLMRRDAQNPPQSAAQLAKSLPADAWRDVAWREGVAKTLHSRFASVLRLTKGFPTTGDCASRKGWKLLRTSSYLLKIGRGWKAGWRAATRRKSWSGGRGSS
jgi:SRSO17 transposase